MILHAFISRGHFWGHKTEVVRPGKAPISLHNARQERDILGCRPLYPTPALNGARRSDALFDDISDECRNKDPHNCKGLTDSMASLMI